MMITSDEYAGGLSGYTVTDCVVRDRNRFTLIATKYLTDAEVQAEEQDLSDPSYRPKRVLPFMREDAPGDRLGWTNLLHWDLLRGGAAQVPDNQFVGVDLQDIDGFAEDDLYAVGGRADVWHYDGQHWAQIEIPTDTWTEAVCCAGDGHVYIAGLAGRKSTPAVSPPDFATWSGMRTVCGAPTITVSG